MTEAQNVLKDLSLLVTCYNKLDYVDAFLAQIDELNRYGCEIVIIDDGSTDGSADKIQSKIAKLQNCKIIRQENQGSAAARNRAIKESKRKFLQFLDLDDLLNIELLVSVFLKADISEDALYLFDYSQGRDPKFPKYQGNFESKLLTKADSQRELLEKKGYWRILYPKKIVLENNFKFTPTFSDLSGKRFILDDLFWLIHIAVSGVTCFKFNDAAILYGYVTEDREINSGANDFSNQASMFPQATSTFIADLAKCTHSHDTQLLENALSRSLIFHSRFVRLENLSSFIKSMFKLSPEYDINKFRIPNLSLRLKLTYLATFFSLKNQVRNIASKNRISTKVWDFFKRLKSY